MLVLRWGLSWYACACVCVRGSVRACEARICARVYNFVRVRTRAFLWQSVALVFVGEVVVAM